MNVTRSALNVKRSTFSHERNTFSQELTTFSPERNTFMAGTKKNPRSFRIWDFGSFRILSVYQAQLRTKIVIQGEQVMMRAPIVSTVNLEFS